MNWAVAARRKQPNKRILASKIDYKSAYRRCHLNADAAVQTCTQLPQEDLAVMALRLTFGGSACPYEWGSSLKQCATSQWLSCTAMTGTPTP